MGHYLNPGNEGFKRALRAKIYIDKSGMIAYLNSVIGTDDGFVCVSRPRRFGKSMAANMLAAYYGKECDSRKLFESRKIAESDSFEAHLNQYDVIFLNIQQVLSSAKSPESVADFLQKSVLNELKEKYPGQVKEDDTHLPTVLANIYAQNAEAKKGFVFILDEWDCIFREDKRNTTAQKLYLDFLKDLFKDRTYVALAYMTGILPIKKYGTHSALNIFDEYSMTAPEMLAEYVGFTEKEVACLCSEYGKDFEEMRLWYDGYIFPENLHIYNPKSVVDAMRSRHLKSFWTNTETYEALQLYIDLNEDGLKEALTEMLVGNSCRLDTGTFQNDMTSFKSWDDILTLLIHLGYLAYDETVKAAFIPNEEVRIEFVRAVRNSGRPELFKLLSTSDELLEAAFRMDEDTVAQKVQEIHSEYTAPIFYNDEQALRMVLMIACIGRTDDYRIYQELPAGTGYADIVLQPKNNTYPPVIIELKWNKNAGGAISQIKEQNYIQGIDSHTGEIMLVGINYDKTTKLHTCKIKKFIK